MPDYLALAERMMDLRAQLHQLSMRQGLSALDQGTLLLLNRLLLQDGTAYPKDLSRDMSVSSARVAALLNHLEGRGLIRRRPDPADNRQTLVTLTEAGRQMILQRREAIRRTVAGALEELGPEDAQAFCRIQEQLIRNFRRHLKQIGPGGDEKELTASPS